MNRKLKNLSWWCFGLAMVFFVLTYVLFHYMTPDGVLTTVFREEAGKPFVTMMVGIWGVMFLFAGVMSRLAGRICFKEE